MVKKSPADGTTQKNFVLLNQIIKFKKLLKLNLQINNKIDTKYTTQELKTFLQRWMKFQKSTEVANESFFKAETPI